MNSETAFQVFTWALAAVSVVGVIMNIKKWRACFFLWAFTNATWTVIDFSKGIYAQAALMAVYFVLAVWGIFAWKEDANETGNKPKGRANDSTDGVWAKDWAQLGERINSRAGFLGVDFDGTLALATTPEDPGAFEGVFLPGALERLDEYCEEFWCGICSSRAYNERGAQGIRSFLAAHGFDVSKLVAITDRKPPGRILDDR